MDERSLHYRELRPEDDLRRLVRCFWEFSVDTNASSTVVHEIFPDGCVSLFACSDRERRSFIVGIGGLYLESITKTFSPGDVVAGARFSPAGAAAILRSDPSALLNRTSCDKEEFPHLLHGIEERLGRDISLELFASALGEQIATGDLADIDDAVALTLPLIEKRRGECTLDELSRAAGLSVRQLQRRFKAASGLTPKQYLRTQRLRAVAVDLATGGAMSWAERAAELGFADQSHLGHELADLTHRAPNAFAESIAKIAHGDLIK